jgi:predicted GIY-YIG superfamily endonuclease
VTQHLYRMYDANENLLYIGVSVNALARFAQHKLDKPWIDDVAKVTIESHKCSRSEIEAMEREAIVLERPRHNVAHNTSVREAAASGDPWGIAQLARRTDGHGHVTFDHFVPFALDEYRGLRESIDRFIDAAHHVDDSGFATLLGRYLTINGMAQLLREIVAARQYPDMHHRCEVEDLPPVQFPIARDADGRCWYMCPACDERWRCWYR